MDTFLTSYPAFAVVEKEYPPVTRQGTTAMGVKGKYTEYRKESWGVAALNVPGKLGDPVTSVTVQVATEEAKRLVNRLAWRIRGATVAGVWSTPRGVTQRNWALSAPLVHSPTLDSPSSYLLTALFAPAIVESFELVDPSSGTVYGTFNPDPAKLPQ